MNHEKHIRRADVQMQHMRALLKAAHEMIDSESRPFVYDDWLAEESRNTDMHVQRMRSLLRTVYNILESKSLPPEYDRLLYAVEQMIDETGE